MQVLKESVRDSIIESAIEEFFNNDYQSANMRNIAVNANITVGNIYRYFTNKSQLFNAIILPAEKVVGHLADFDKIITNKDIQSLEDLNNLTQYVMRVIGPYTKQIYIIILNSSSEPFKRLKDGLENLIILKVSKYYPGKFTRSFLEVISKNFIEALFNIITDNISNQQKMILLLSDLIVFYFRDLNNRMFE